LHPHELEELDELEEQLEDELEELEQWCFLWHFFFSLMQYFFAMFVFRAKKIQSRFTMTRRHRSTNYDVETYRHLIREIRAVRRRLMAILGTARQATKSVKGRFAFPRKYSRSYCMATPCHRMGFSQRASCRPYKNCFPMMKKKKKSF
jgi:hypothetical protein